VIARSARAAKPTPTTRPRAAAKPTPAAGPRAAERLGSRRPGSHGQSLVEATVVLLVFFALLLGVVDCAQVLIAHESLVERVRGAVRWGVVHPWGPDGTGPDAIANLVLYDQTTEPVETTAPFLGLKPANIVITHTPATADRPDDETLSVAIVDFESHFFSPWLAKTIVSPRPVLISAPMAARMATASPAPASTSLP
jgi:hypothetical protein